MRLILALLLAARCASAYTIAGGESDTSNSLWWVIPAAGCVGTTANSNWNLTGSDVPTATCVTTGTNVKVRAVLAFGDGTTPSSIVQPCVEMPLMTAIAPTPATASYISGGPITVSFIWWSAGASGNARWCASVICRGDAETGDGAAYPTLTCVDDAAKTTTLQDNLATITLSGAATSSCAANEVLNLKFCRDSDHANDTTVGDANYEVMSVAWQRFQ